MAEIYLKRYDTEYEAGTVKYHTVKLELLVDSDGLKAVEEVIANNMVGTTLTKNLYEQVKELSHGK